MWVLVFVIGLQPASIHGFTSYGLCDKAAQELAYMTDSDIHQPYTYRCLLVNKKVQPQPQPKQEN